MKAAKEKARLKQFGGDPIAMPLIWMVDQSTESKKLGSFDYAKNPNIVFNAGGLQIFISDPAVV